MKTDRDQKFKSAQLIRKGFEHNDYICSGQMATTLYLAYHLDKPVLVEGPAGVGKTELAKVMASYLRLPLIRLQCYEGLDEAKALYEWEYAKQLLYTQMVKGKINDLIAGAARLGPLLISPGGGVSPGTPIENLKAMLEIVQASDRKT